MGPKAHGRILFWEGVSLWLLSAPPGRSYPKTDCHRHHVVQLTLALTGRVSFDGENGPISGAAIAVAPDAPHAFEGTGLVAHLFVAPEGKGGRRLVRGLFAGGSIVVIPAHRLGDLPRCFAETFADPSHTDEALRALGDRTIARLAGEAGPAGVAEPRITRLLAWLTQHLDQPVSLSEAAAILGLSAGRARHLFVEQTGLPFRTYLLWLRLVRAVELYAGGASLTDAAHGAGFADSAHLSRTFRRMFGIAAASLQLA